jgi:hypothetical protein
MGITRLFNRRKKLPISIPNLKKKTISEVMGSKINNCTFTYILADGKRLVGERCCSMSTKFVEAETIGSFNDFKEYKKKVGSKIHVQIYNEESNSIVFDFGHIELIDVIIDMPDYDALTLKLIWKL